ncbi:MAG: trimethylamine methyltransferase family protein [Desulfosarcina sp.]
MIQTSRTYTRSVEMRVLTEDQIWEIRQAAFEVIEKSGFKCLHPGARKLLAGAGAVVADERVKIPRYIVEGCLATAPKGWTVYDRNGRRAMEVEGRKSHYSTSTASPNTKDALTGEYHETRVADIAVGARVADALPNIDFVMPMGSAQDVNGRVADLYEFEAVVANTVKPVVFIGYTPTGCEYVFEMAAVVAGGMDRLRERPFVLLYPEAISPFVFPRDVVDRIFIAADRFMPQVPGTTAQPGATAPMTLAGTVVQITAESLIHIVLAQLRNPGCPVCMSGNVGVLDMATALMTFGAPEGSLGLAAQAEVAQSFGLPTWGLAGATDAKRLDAQAGIESTFGIFSQALAGLNLIHDVGYMASGMACSCEQLVMGNEIIGMTKRFVAGVTVDAETLARDVIEAVGPGGNFLAQRHTVTHLRRELWQARLFNRQPIAAWQSAGQPTMEDRVREEVRRLVGTHEPQPLDGNVCDELTRLKNDGEREILARNQES